MGGVQHRLRGVLARLHAWRDADPRHAVAYRIAVGVIGGLVTVLGVIMIPYPGPGWLVVFAGLGILATEFAWARRVLDFARDRYEAWEVWLRRQNGFVRVVVLGALFVMLVVILWLLGVFTLADEWFGLGWPWLHSPVFG